MKTYVIMNIIMHIKGHDDDVTAIALSNNGLLVATGQLGKNPLVHIWGTGVKDKGGECKIVCTIGKV